MTDIERFRAELSQGIPDSIRQAFITRVLKAKPALAEARAKQRANQRRLGRRSINKALTVLSMVFNYAVRNQWMMRNPAEYVDHARDDRPIDQRPLDMDVLIPEEVAALREAATPATYRDGKLITNNYRLLISFALFTGCRIGGLGGRLEPHRLGERSVPRSPYLQRRSVSRTQDAHLLSTALAPDIPIEGAQSLADGVPQESV